MTPKSNYDASSITVLEGLEAVRVRPGMYIGSVTTKGLNHLVYEIVDNSVDEHLAGFCDCITVTLEKDGSATVSDNGRGIPVGMHEKGMSAERLVFTTLHAGGKFDNSAYKTSGGLHGVGSSVVNALSERLELTVKDGEHVYFQRFERGHYDEQLKVIGDTKETGTSVMFKADGEIFESTVYDYEVLLKRLREQAFLNAGIKIVFSDKRDKDNIQTETLHYEGGIRQFVEHIHATRGLEALSGEVVYISGTQGDSFAEIALQYNDSYNPVILSFANNIHTKDGGTHETGFKNALLKVINEYGKKFGKFKEKESSKKGKDTSKKEIESLKRDDVLEGLTAIVSVKLTECEFEGQTKGRLGNPEVKPFVENLVTEKLMNFLEENPEIANIIFEKCLSAYRAREAAKRARDAERKKNAFGNSSMPEKLADCAERDARYTEVYIVEGDSAGGSAKQGRDRRYQAILPLWGKMLNVEKARIDRIYGNDKLEPVVTALGTGIGEDFDIEKLRYGKVIIMADADVDGMHIRTLLLTFFFRYMRPLITNGNVYIAQPPLFRVERKKKIYYAFSDEERDKYIAELSEDGKYKDVEVQRYKGLGEMDPEQLWETTMDPEHRTIVRIGMEDALKADETFSILMGDKVEPRRNFIEKNARFAQDLDI